jgi:hypothetical protein
MPEFIKTSMQIQSLALVAFVVLLLPIRIEKIIATPTFWEVAAGVGYILIIATNTIWLIYGNKKIPASS